MKKIAVIGAGGFVGKGLLEIFDASGVECIAVGRESPLPSVALDAVIDCNGEGRRFWCNQYPKGSYQRNVESVQMRLNRLSSDVYVYISTVDVYGNGRAALTTSREDTEIPVGSLDTYGLHKYQAECMVLQHARRPLVLRCGTVIGPGLRKNPVFDMLNDAPLRMTDESSLNLIRLETLSGALQQLLSKACSGIYNIAASAPATIADIRSIIAEYRGTSPEDMLEHEEKITINYAVNAEKISALLDMPTSEEALRTFLEADVTLQAAPENLYER